jgi:hypothetical protein
MARRAYRYLSHPRFWFLAVYPVMAWIFLHVSVPLTPIVSLEPFLIGLAVYLLCAIIVTGTCYSTLRNLLLRNIQGEKLRVRERNGLSQPKGD